MLKPGMSSRRVLAPSFANAADASALGASNTGYLWSRRGAQSRWRRGGRVDEALCLLHIPRRWELEVELKLARHVQFSAVCQVRSNTTLALAVCQAASLFDALLVLPAPQQRPAQTHHISMGSRQLLRRIMCTDTQADIM